MKYQFRTLTVAPNYEVSTIGEVRSKRTGKLMNTYCTKGYMHTQITFPDGKSKTMAIHQLVAIAYLGHIPCGMKRVVDHINHDKLDNSVTNLRIVSNRVNTTRKIKSPTNNYVGVYHHKHSNRWYARTYQDKGNYVHVGSFVDEVTAYEAYVIAVGLIEDSNYIFKSNKQFRSDVKDIMKLME